MLYELQTLSGRFVRDVVMKASSENIMNAMQRCILSLYTYDDKAEDISPANVFSQSLSLIAKMPLIAVYSYHAYRHFRKDEMLFMRNPEKGLSMAENLLLMLRPDGKYTELEAKVLDIALILHAEHGGGNNSTFTTHVVSSSGTDTYSAVAAALGSLKGPKHGGANIKVAEMLGHLKHDVEDITSADQVADFLKKVINKQAGDRSGLVYGMGHAVYTLSDPRQKILKREALKLAEEKGYADEFKALELIETLTPEIFALERNNTKKICANVDLYSGLIYEMLGIPEDLYTPLFAVARVAGWSAHRIEELISGNRVIRPAYKNISSPKEYAFIDERVSDFKNSSVYVPIEER